MVGTPILYPTFNLVGTAEHLDAHFDQLPLALRTELTPVIERLTAQLLGAVRSIEPRRTGRLRSSTRMFVDAGADFVRGRVVVMGDARLLVSAGALEYGAPGRRGSGPVDVRAHTRRGSIVSAFQRRHLRITARRFLHGPAETLRPKVEAEVTAAVGRVFV